MLQINCWRTKLQVNQEEPESYTQLQEVNKYFNRVCQILRQRPKRMSDAFLLPIRRCLSCIAAGYFHTAHIVVDIHLKSTLAAVSPEERVRLLDFMCLWLLLFFCFVLFIEAATCHFQKMRPV